PAPSVLQWYPEFATGTFTGQNQGPWSVTGDDRYVVMGGEFPRVNNTGQQGIVRFAVKQIAGENVGPRHSGSNWTEIQAEPIASGAVRVSWLTNFDLDSEHLTYDVVRNGNTGNPVHRVTLPSQPWNRYWTGFTDTGLTPGATYTYQIRVRDSAGNLANTNAVTVTANGTGELSEYARAVMRDGVEHYWRLND